MQWFDDFVSIATQKLVLVGSAIGIVVSVFQELITQRYGGWRAYVSRGAAAVLVGVGSYLLLASMDAPEAMKVGIACSCTWCAKDVLDGLKTISSLFANNPFEVLERLRAALRGGKADK